MKNNNFYILLSCSILFLIWAILYKYIWIFEPAKTVGAIILVEFIYAIALSFISSFIFYIFNVFIPENRKEKEKNEKIAFIVNENLKRIEQVLDTIRFNIYQIGNLFSGENLIQALANISYAHNGPDGRTYDQYYWISFFNECRNAIQLICNNMIDQYNNDLDRELLIELNNFPAKCALSSKFNFNPSLKDHNDDIIQLFNDFKTLKKMCKDKYGY